MANPKQQKTGMRPKVGDTVVLARRGELLDATVLKSGTKYFETKCTWDIQKFRVGGKEGQSQINWELESVYAYSSREVFAELEERKTLLRKLSDITQNIEYRTTTITTESIRKAIELLESDE